MPNYPRLRSLIIREAHDAVTSGHLGIDKTYHRIKKHFWWKHLLTDVEDYAKPCGSCQSYKSSNLKPAGLMQAMPVPMTKADTVSLDFVGPMPMSTRKNDYILVMVDKYTKRA